MTHAACKHDEFRRNARSHNCCFLFFNFITIQCVRYGESIAGAKKSRVWSLQWVGGAMPWSVFKIVDIVKPSIRDTSNSRLPRRFNSLPEAIKFIELILITTAVLYQNRTSGIFRLSISFDLRYLSLLIAKYKRYGIDIRCPSLRAMFDIVLDVLSPSPSSRTSPRRLLPARRFHVRQKLQRNFHGRQKHRINFLPAEQSWTPAEVGDWRCFYSPHRLVWFARWGLWHHCFPCLSSLGIQRKVSS